MPLGLLLEWVALGNRFSPVLVDDIKGGELGGGGLEWPAVRRICTVRCTQKGATVTL